mmetsp:Transcript_31710/g.63476  ORF Transcript_31710/g.63476 Transcript_31710/m.63476 type:complete len:466 (+) Transcript_31710:55-1452(+)
MKFYNLCLFLFGASTASTAAFVPQSRPNNVFSKSTSLFSVKNGSPIESIDNSVRNTISGLAVAAALWTAPATMAGNINSISPGTVTGNSMIASSMASAKEMASGSGSRVNKDPDSLLRYGLPIMNKEVRELQKNIELIRQDVASKRKTSALDDIKKVKAIINTKESKMVPSCRDAKVCSDIIASVKEKLEPLEGALKASQDYMNGSDQERDELDKSYNLQDALQKQLTQLEEQMVPAGYLTPVPEEYNDLPQLRGRATVEMVLKKPDGESFDIEGSLSKEAKMTMIIDGYTAPVTGGNFVDLVQKGFYNNMDIQRSDGFVVQTGDPKGEAEGYVGTPSKSVGAGKYGERLIPLEIFVQGDKGPFYESTIEDEGRGGQATVLPFSSYGAMGWAREEYEPNSGSSQFFWLLFDSDLTPAGKNVLDGRYPCFGYVVEGADFLRDIKEGDIIVSAKVTEGAENLVQPKQ